VLDGKFINCLLEKSSQKSSKKWTENIHWSIAGLCWFCLWVGVVIGHFLENRLDESDGGVDATTGNTARLSNCAVKSETNSHGIDWHFSASIVLNDNEHECDKHECADSFNGEYSKDIVTAIVTSINWAELGNPEVVSSDWNLLNILLLIWESHDTDGTSEDGTETLANNNEE